MSRKLISRAGKSYFARIYRDDWVGPKSFADSKYGGNEQAAKAARTWVAQAEARLPKIPPRPELRRATVTRQKEDRWQSPSYYYQVYLPIVDTKWKQEVPTAGDYNRQPYELQKLYFKDHDEEQEQRTLAYDMAQARNEELQAAYREALAAWYLERDKIMEEIQELWPGVKELVQPPQQAKLATNGGVT